MKKSNSQQLVRARSVSKDFKLLKDSMYNWRRQQQEKKQKEEIDVCNFMPDIKSSAKKYDGARGDVEGPRFDQLHKLSKLQREKIEEMTR